MHSYDDSSVEVVVRGVRVLVIDGDDWLSSSPASRICSRAITGRGPTVRREPKEGEKRELSVSWRRIAVLSYMTRRYRYMRCKDRALLENRDLRALM